jgi:hypothetical protein
VEDGDTPYAELAVEHKEDVRASFGFMGKCRCKACLAPPWRVGGLLRGRNPPRWQSERLQACRGATRDACWVDAIVPLLCICGA